MVHTVLITLIVIGALMRIGFPFLQNPLDFLRSDPLRHLSNAYDVKGQTLPSILNAPGFEIYLSTLTRIIGQNRTLHALAMAILSVTTPWLWYRWCRELTRNKTVSLFGYVIFTFLPSWFRIFGYLMDSVILLPLTGAALWLTWRAARKMTWPACVLAAIFCGAACATKSVALPVTLLPWLFVGHKIAGRFSKPVACTMTATSVAIVLCLYGLGPFKVWTHTGAVVLVPDGLYNQRYFESGAHDIQVTNTYNDVASGGHFVSVSVWGSPSLGFAPFHPFNEWMSDRKGRYLIDLDYQNGRDYATPIYPTLKDRLKYTFENIIFLFFQYNWPEDTKDWRAPFPNNLWTIVRFIWFPLTAFVVGTVIWSRKREFMGWYFVAVTLAFMLQQSAIMEGRYKKLWDGVAIAAFLNVVAGSKRYKSWEERQLHLARVERRKGL